MSRDRPPNRARGRHGRFAETHDTLAIGLVLGYLADLLLGDPRSWHPVAGFGRAAARLERSTYAANRGAGVAHVGLLVGGVVAAGALVERRLPARAHILLVTATTWTVLGGRSLGREAAALEDLLLRGELEGARQRIRNLVGRDPSRLDPDELARACIESVAENGADAIVSPLFWGALAGVPGLLGLRAVNTLDAMIGHRTPRYMAFGWAAARLDDAANWVPARVTVLATALATGSPGGARRVLRIAARDSGRHPSPNAGPVEAAFAAALDRRLGGCNTYDGQSEDRGVLGDGPAVTAADIPAARALQRRIGVIALLTLVTGRVLVRRRGRPGTLRRG